MHAEAWQHQVPPLPFELQVLEVVLGDVVALASQLARDLEAVVHPALDSLMKSVSNDTCAAVMPTRHAFLLVPHGLLLFVFCDVCVQPGCNCQAVTVRLLLSGFYCHRLLLSGCSVRLLLSGCYCQAVAVRLLLSGCIGCMGCHCLHCLYPCLASSLRWLK